ncbi:hypothetical protein ANN_17408 [Periplaneta americana]|uniref:Uncharacterized protein n=1 Tax=Periplaneta americana TaxID=6978 RepID=A0ABQ8SU26_PERAM|nr:hypothetical protein ANN_17408 [Periplaneta americana]
MVRDQVSTEGVAKQRPVALQVPLGQGWSDVQGRCRVATANSSYAKAQDAYDELNCVIYCVAFCSHVVSIVIYNFGFCRELVILDLSSALIVHFSQPYNKSKCMMSFHRNDAEDIDTDYSGTDNNTDAIDDADTDDGAYTYANDRDRKQPCRSRPLKKKTQPKKMKEFKIGFDIKSAHSMDTHYWVKLQKGRGNVYDPIQFDLSKVFLPNKYNKPVALSREKREDIQELSNYIPPSHRRYFSAIISGQQDERLIDMAIEEASLIIIENFADTPDTIYYVQQLWRWWCGFRIRRHMAYANRVLAAVRRCHTVHGVRDVEDKDR